MPNNLSRRRRGAAVCALVLATACTDRHPLATTPEPETLHSVECIADVSSGTLSCSAPPPPASSGARTSKILGGQDVYVKLANTGTSYDVGTEVYQTNVTVQNLISQTIGTPDGVTLSGVKVFFATPPTVATGSGVIGVLGEDGEDLFLGSNQKYYLYNEMLTPYQISAAKTWRFQVPSTVSTFRFQVYVFAPMTDGSISMIDRLWTGLVTSAWGLGGNWTGGLAADSTHTVAVPAAALLTGPNQPVLDANAHVKNLRVGTGSTLGLGGFTMRVDGSVDAMGAVSGGTTWMTAPGSYLQGNVDALRITGAAMLQGSTRATGAVSVQDGSLSVRDQALSISIP